MMGLLQPHEGFTWLDKLPHAGPHRQHSLRPLHSYVDIYTKDINVPPAASPGSTQAGNHLDKNWNTI